MTPADALFSAEAASSTAEARVSYEEVSTFLYREARLQDTHAYDEWEALWTDDASYWVPVGGDATDPTTQISLIYDNRARIGTRIRQLNTGKRYAQTPRSQLARVIGNVEVLDRRDAESGPEIDATATFIAVEWRLGAARTWAGRTHWTLRETADGLRLARKKVVLVNSGEEIPTLAFLI